MLDRHKEGEYDDMQWYGRPTDKEIEMIYCGEIGKKKSYNVIEVETTRIHYYRTFKNEQEYDEYTEGKQRMRTLYNELNVKRKTNTYEQSKQSEREAWFAMKNAKKNWNVMARDFVIRWGADNVPEAMRYAIDMMLEEETDGYRWLNWPLMTRSLSGFLEGTRIHWYKVDMNQWANVTEELE